MNIECIIINYAEESSPCVLVRWNFNVNANVALCVLADEGINYIIKTQGQSKYVSKYFLTRNNVASTLYPQN